MTNPLAGQGVSEKLTRENHLLWQSQVLPPIRGARLLSFLDSDIEAPPETIEVETDGKKKEEVNPAYEAWLEKDQQVLTFLLNSLSKGILVCTIGKETSAEVWGAIKTMFASQSKTWVSNLRITLAKTRKENMTTPQLFARMKSLADKLAAAGREIEEEELVEYLLAGLDDNYNPLVAAIGINGSGKDLTVSDLYAHVVAYDNRMELLQDYGGGSSVNGAFRGGRGRPHGRGYRGGRRGGGRGNGRGNGRGGRGNGGGGRRGGGHGGGKDHDAITCQICGKPGHEAWKCWHRYSDDEDEGEEEKGAHVASYGVDTNWCYDTGATDHIIGELNKLAMKEKYHGREQVDTAYGQGSSHDEGTS